MLPSTTAALNATPRYRGWLIFTIMMLAILEVLDSTIINVSLPAMMASLGANQNEITWVLTSYVVASAIVLPLTGFLVARFGRQAFLIGCTAGFMLASVACGLATSLPEMVLFRVIQGLCGSSLIPMSQTIMRESFPADQQTKAMAIWGMGIIAAPVFGPALGGFITEHASWRWVFYINMPCCILGLLLIPLVIPKIQAVRERLDGLGVILMVAAVGGLQIFLDKGNELGWLDATSMQVLVLFTLLAFAALFVRNRRQAFPVIPTALYRDRNFALCSAVMLMYCAGVFSYVTLQPMMLESYFGYSAMQAGFISGPLGLASALGMALSPRLGRSLRPHQLMMIGLGMISAGLWHQSGVALTAPLQFFITTNLCIGFGMGLVMVPISTQAFASLSKAQLARAAGWFGYARMLGTSVGVSLMSTLLSHMTQVGWAELSTHVTRFNPALTSWLAQQGATHLTPVTLLHLTQTLGQQAGLTAFADAFRTLSISVALLIPFALVLGRQAPATSPHSTAEFH